MAKVGLKNGSYTALEFVADPQAAADAAIQYSESGVAKWRHGNDTTDDHFRVSIGGVLGVADVIDISTGGAIIYPLQPAFLALSGDDAAVTGDGTSFTCLMDNEVYDQGGNYDGNSIFTAPVTGKYHFDTNVQVTGVLATHTVGLYGIRTTNHNFQTINAPSKIFNVNTTFSTTMGTDADMDIGDTCRIDVQISNGTKVIGVIGAGATFTYFSGRLVC